MVSRKGSYNTLLIILMILSSNIWVESFLPVRQNAPFHSEPIFATVYNIMPPADLTPAVDKFVRMPTNIGAIHELKQLYFMSAKGPAPDGPEPFGLVSEELKPLSDYVKELVVSENPVLTMAASHFFEKRQGKRFRPTIVALIGRALAPSLSEYVGSNLNKLQLQLGQITEMIHVASLIHDDVLDEADTRRGGASGGRPGGQDVGVAGEKFQRGTGGGGSAPRDGLRAQVEGGVGGNVVDAGAGAVPSYDLGEHFQLSTYVPIVDHSFADALALLGDRADLRPG
eukprot:gene18-32_t